MSYADHIFIDMCQDIIDERNQHGREKGCDRTG